jgi:hypothetical protein
LRLASGKLVTLLNTNGFYEAGAFVRVESAFKKNPTASFHMGFGFRTDLAGNLRRPFYLENFRFNQ